MFFYFYHHFVNNLVVQIFDEICSAIGLVYPNSGYFFYFCLYIMALVCSKVPFVFYLFYKYVGIGV